MDVKIIVTVFVTVFLAELGDKTQLATLLYAADPHTSKLAVFLGATLALIAASGLGVLAGGLLGTTLSEHSLRYIAGLGFIAIGLWTLLH